MARVMIGWELGAGLGHATRLLSVARGLSAKGHRPFLVFRNLVEPWSTYHDAGFPIFQAPVWQPRAQEKNKPFHAAAISDIFSTQGFTDPDDLLPMVMAWQSLIDSIRPEIIVSDYSPTLCLAAWGVTPMVIVGDGFTTPPEDTPAFPALRPSAPVTATQESLLAVIHEVQRRRQRPAPSTMPKLFSAEARFICTIPELDPYRKQRHEPAAGPFSPVPPPLPSPMKPGFFAYLAADAPTFKSAVMGLAAVPFPGSFYIRRPPDSIVKMLTNKGHHVFPTPAPIIDLLRDVPLIAHHGGVGTTETALGVGRPQLLFPRHLEQKLTAAALHELGVGLAAPREAAEKLVVALVQKLVKEQPHGARAQKFAQTLQARGTVDNVARIVERCCEIIASRAKPA